MSDFALVSRQGGSEQRIPLLPPGPLQVGRLEGCEVLLDNKQVSRRHARLEWNAVAGAWRLVEAGGQAGTFVNGERLTAGDARDLGDGDVVGIGPVELTLEVCGHAGATMLPGDSGDSAERYERRRRRPNDAFAHRDLNLLLELGESLHGAPDETDTRAKLVDAVERATGFANIACVMIRGSGEPEVVERRGDVLDRTGRLRMSRTMLRSARDGMVLVTDKSMAGDQAIAASLERVSVNQAFCIPIGEHGRFGFLYADNGTGRGDQADRQRLEDAADVSDAVVRMAGLHLDKLAHSRDMVQLIADAVDRRDPCTGGHSRRVAALARVIGQVAGFDERACSLLYESGRVHDIGKIAVRDAVLLKQGPERLTEEEFAEIRRHPQEGHDLLRQYPIMQAVLPGVLEHHEKWDGTGYPNRLKGEAISWLGRVLAVADVFDAITCERPYRSGFPLERARAIIEEGSGTHFDPTMVKAFLSIDSATLREHMERPTASVPAST